MNPEAQARWLIARGWLRPEDASAAAPHFDPGRDQDFAATLQRLRLLAGPQVAELRAAHASTRSATRPVPRRDAPPATGGRLSHSNWSQSGEAGPSVLGDYAIEGELSRGAMGIVYRARAENGRAVAIKLLQRPDEAEELTRFAREAEVLIKLDHPNIVQILDLGNHQGLPYLVMELVEGEPLSARIKAAARANERLDPLQAATWLQQIGAALSVCHQKGLAHRDVKPQNIVIEEKSGQAVLIDFGLIKLPRSAEDGGLSQGLTASGAILGTPAFMAPEKFLGRDHGSAGDIWSWTATLFMALTGERPFLGDNMIDIYRAVEDARWPRASLLENGLQAFVPICEAGFAKDSSQRPTIDALLESLEDAVAQYAPRRPGARLRLALGACALIALAAAVGLALWSQGARPAPTRAAAASPLAKETRIGALLTPEERALEAALRAAGVTDPAPWLPLASADRWERASDAERAAVRAQVSARLGSGFEFIGDQKPPPDFPNSRPMAFRHRASRIEFLLVPGGVWNWSWHPSPQNGALHSYLRAMTDARARPSDVYYLGMYGERGGAILDALAPGIEGQSARRRKLTTLFGYLQTNKASRELGVRLGGIFDGLSARADEWARWQERFRQEAAILEASMLSAERVVLPFLLAHHETTVGEFAPAEAAAKNQRQRPVRAVESLAPWFESHVASGFRLPTRLEWRHAASNGDPDFGPWGLPAARAEALQRSAERCERENLKTSGRGGFPWTDHREERNRFGLVDLLGNVEERVKVDARAWARAMREAGKLDEEAPRLEAEIAELEMLAGGTLDRGFALCRADFFLWEFKALKRGRTGFRVAVSLFGDER